MTNYMEGQKCKAFSIVWTFDAWKQINRWKTLRLEVVRHVKGPIAHTYSVNRTCEWPIAHTYSVNRTCEWPIAHTYSVNRTYEWPIAHTYSVNRTCERPMVYLTYNSKSLIVWSVLSLLLDIAGNKGWSWYGTQYVQGLHSTYL